MRSYFIGIDVGTQGARAALINDAGDLVGTGETPFPFNDRSREEQSPEAWWKACMDALKTLMAAAKCRLDHGEVRTISVTSTSGTLIPLGHGGRPLHPAIMYSDKRSAEAAALCKEAAIHAGLPPGAYKNFNTSSGLSKMVWFLQTFPEKVNGLERFIHATDYLMGKLCGRWDITDYTNALKSGYDIHRLEWPAYLYDKLPLRQEWLQTVVPSGTPVAAILPALANELGLSPEVKVVAGMTDGCASQVASGAVAPGAWNTTIGTTLVIKGVTTKAITDPEGRLYNHRHPDGYAMPGGASNTGADWITEEFGGSLQELNEKAGQLIPTGRLSWPLRQQGERFPFIAPRATGFEPAGLSGAERYTANMEGVAYLERCAYDLITQLSGEKVDAIYTAGGGSNSDTWLKIRSNVLNLPIHKMKYTAGSVGAAIVGASRTCFHSLTEAAARLTQTEKTIRPEKELARQYENHYHRFINALKARGIITG